MFRWRIAACIACSLLFGQVSADKYAGEFLTLGMGGRAAGLGGAYCSIVDDASAPYWNPAAVSLVDQKEILLMHAESFGGIVAYDCVGFVFPYSKSAFGANLLRLSVRNIPLTENLEFWDWGRDGVPDTDDEGEGNGVYDQGEWTVYDERRIVRVTNSDLALFLTYGWSFSNRISVGANLKIIRREIGEYSAYGSGADFGIIYRPIPALSIGVNVQDATSTFISWSTGTWEKITPTLKLGISTSHWIRPLRGTFLVSIDQDIRFEGRRKTSQFSVGKVSDDFRLGFEYLYSNTLGVRLGSDYGDLTAGLGFKYRNYSIDYAFLSHPDLRGSYRLSASASF